MSHIYVGAAVESLLRELEERLERLSSNNDDLTTRLINMEKKYNTSESRLSSLNFQIQGLNPHIIFENIFYRL